MLNIGQEVFVVCKFMTDGDKYRIYVARKEINKISREKDGTIVYTAGNHDELRFAQNEDGEYRSFGRMAKPVFLTKEEAEKERQAKIQAEKEEA